MDCNFWKKSVPRHVYMWQEDMEPQVKEDLLSHTHLIIQLPIMKIYYDYTVPFIVLAPCPACQKCGSVLSGSSELQIFKCCMSISNENAPSSMLSLTLIQSLQYTFPHTPVQSRAHRCTPAHIHRHNSTQSDIHSITVTILHTQAYTHILGLTTHIQAKTHTFGFTHSHTSTGPHTQVQKFNSGTNRHTQIHTYKCRPTNLGPHTQTAQTHPIRYTHSYSDTEIELRSTLHAHLPVLFLFVKLCVSS